MSTDDKSIWRTKHTVYSYEIDANKKAMLHVLFGYMIDCAWSHVNATEFSYGELKKQNLMWVLARFLMIIREYPKWSDTITVETWGKGVDSLFTLRDFVIYAENRDKLITATSSWLMLDKDTHRPQRLHTLQEKWPWQLDKNELDVKLKKLPELRNPETSTFDRVRFSDVDANKHARALKYIQWIIDSYPSEIVENYRIRELEIDFLNETAAGNDILVKTETVDGSDLTFLNSIIVRHDDQELCRAKVKWVSLDHGVSP